MKKALAILLSLVFVISVFAGCGKSESSSAPAEASSTAEAESSEETGDTATESKDGYTISYNHQMVGDWISEFYNTEVQVCVKNYLGYNYLNPAFNFDADQEITDCQNVIAAGTNAHIYYGCFTTITEKIAGMFKDAKVPFVMPDQLPTEANMKVLADNPYFTGAVGGDQYQCGYIIGKLAAGMGYKNAIVMTGGIGDVMQDGRTDGFTAGFEEGGGKVIATVRCNDPSEGNEKGGDVMAASGAQADCYYGGDNGYAIALANGAKNYNYDLMGFCSDVNSDGLDMIREGKLIGDGGAVVDMSLALGLLINYLDGHQILDENGKAPIFDNLHTFIIDSSNVDDYETYYLGAEEGVLSREVFESLLWRNNPDVTYQDWYNFIDTYNLEKVVEMQKK